MLTTRQDRILRYSLLLAMAACAASATACYTLLKHPQVSELNYGRPNPERACTDCHAAGARASYLRPEHLRAAKAPWSDLDHPWWIPDGPDSTGGHHAPR